MILRFLFLVFIIFFAKYTNAQQQPWGNWGCYDSLLVDPFAYCYPEYEPVCACNDTTYRNDCYARNTGHQQFTSGICEAVDFNIKINPVYYALELDIILREEGPVVLHIMDWFGKVYYYDYFSNINRQYLYIDVGNFQQGLYIVSVKNYEERLIKKFIKIDR